MTVGAFDGPVLMGHSLGVARGRHTVVLTERVKTIREVCLGGPFQIFERGR